MVGEYRAQKIIYTEYLFSVIHLIIIYLKINKIKKLFKLILDIFNNVNYI